MSDDMANCGYKLASVLLTRGEIEDRIGKIASAIADEYRGETVVFVCILKGASVFMADLIRGLGASVDARIDFMAVSSYGNSDSTSGVVKILKDMDSSAEGKNIVIVEDIMDTGLTLNYLQGVIRGRSPKSLKTVVLLEKPDRRQIDCQLDHVGFKIPDKFVVGCGLDYAGMWRHLPDIWCLQEA